MSFTPDAASTEDVLAAVFASSLPPVPPQEQDLGNSTVSWWETDPGHVYVHAEGGTPDDRHYAKSLVRLELEAHGYQHVQFDLDEMPAIHEGRARHAGWSDIMAKAKRLIQSGQVQMLRNGFNYIVGHVIGDHGEYDTEISRDDPNSRAITGWQCSCPWDQYAWQRTRKWKKFEGRPCAHVLGLYWKGLSTPFDEDLSPEQAQAMGTGQAIHAPAVPEHAPGREPGANEAPGHHPEPDTHEMGLPRSFSPEGDIIQGDQLSMPPEAMGGPLGPAQAPMAPPAGQGSPAGPVAPGVIPPFPGAQMEMQWAGPGTTPGGGKSPPGSYTVPGAKPPNQPANPLQNPGTYSKVGATYYHGSGEARPPISTGMPDWDSQFFMADRPDYAALYGPQVERIDLDPSARILHEGSQEGQPIFDAAIHQARTTGGHYALHALNEARKQGYHAVHYRDQSAFGTVLLDPSKVISRTPHTSAQFQAPQVVRLKKPMLGLDRDGMYREVPVGKSGEVRHQDPTMGWVEVEFPLDDTGVGEPHSVTCFLEPSDIELTDSTNAFIRRKAHAIVGAVANDPYNYLVQALHLTEEGPWFVDPQGTKLRLRMEHDGEVMTIMEMLCVPQGTGLGSRVVEALQDFAEETGQYLEVNDVQNPAFWDRFSIPQVDPLEYSEE